jgi:hypothetical protein
MSRAGDKGRDSHHLPSTSLHLDVLNLARLKHSAGPFSLRRPHMGQAGVNPEKQFSLFPVKAGPCKTRMRFRFR